MNKNECKKYIKRAYFKLFSQKKSMTPENLAIEMRREINNEADIYISYAKLAIHNLNKSATKVTDKELASQIDILPTIYNQSCAIQKAMRL